MPQQLSKLSFVGRVYILSVSAIGLSVAAYSLAQVLVQQVNFLWLILAALTVLSGSFTVRIPRITARLSVSDTFVFACTLLFGPAAGTVTVVLEALVISLRSTHYREPYRVLFNLSLAAVSMWVASKLFFLVSGIQPYSVEQTPLAQIAFPLFLFTLTYFLLNTWLVAFALAFEQGKAPYQLWRKNFMWLAVNYYSGASVAGLLVSTKTIEPTTLGIIVPLLLISYLTFKTSMGRIDDANKHLSELNKLYLSTIETLAMAIDAKDQITHGHIRRVQRLAVGLAEVVGVKEDAQIKAIEAAALLHDMGKLAIPEYILNKPGKLTASEFDVMKQHANIGADILGSIQFPYPVVPIVRHHHESWDGTGYPDGLKGVAIPLGARILSVVDCFDALTSDRPYRPRLSTEDAVAILVQRRGTMYDPLVVDKFIEAQQHLSEIAADREAETEALESIATKLRIVPEPETSGPSEVDVRLPLKALTLLRSIRPAPSGIAIDDVGLLISSRLSKLANFSSLAIFVANDTEHSIKCRYADGKLAGLVETPEIPLGEKLSGWVAAHRTAIWNSDATLDLSTEAARAAAVRLGSSIPLIDNEVLVGTVTLYSGAGDEIGLEQRMLIQAVAPQLAKVLASSVAHDEIAAIDGRNADDRDAIYSVLDALLSTRARGQERTDPDRLSIVRIEWHVDSDSQQSESMRATLERAIAFATNTGGHVVRLGSNDVLVVAPMSHLLSAGLEPTSQRPARRTNIVVTEIANSLELRETLGFTVTTEVPASVEKRLIH